jgi:hypothetical protein
MRNAFVPIVLFSVLAVPAKGMADSVVQTNQWYEFSFTAVGVQAQGCYPADPSNSALNCLPSAANNSVFAPAPAWDFNITAATGTLYVTDAFLYGDSFDVFDGGAPIFSTPNVAYTGSGCGDDPDNCLADPNSSHASFVLGPGLQSITITPNTIGDAGAGYFEIVETPEPIELPVLLAIAAFSVRTIARRRPRRK